MWRYAALIEGLLTPTMVRPEVSIARVRSGDRHPAEKRRAGFPFRRRPKGKTMKLLTNPLSKREEIKQLFTKTFTDSEGQGEGTLIWALAHDLITDTNPQDLYCFVATDFSFEGIFKPFSIADNISSIVADSIRV